MVSATRWFFDTEFIDTGSIIEPISIGIVSEDGDRQFDLAKVRRFLEAAKPYVK